MEENDEEIPPLEISTKLKEEIKTIETKNVQELVPELKSFVTTLTCNICYDPFVNPVLTGCSHSFCSLCIRKYLVYKQQCPVCGTETSDGLLRSNKVASECSDNLRNLVTRLESFISDKSINTKVQPVKSIKNKEPEDKINESDSENENFEPYQAKSRSLERKKSNISTPLKENNRNVVETIDEVIKNVSYSTKDEQQGSSEKKKELDTSQENKNDNLVTIFVKKEESKTECMVCKVLVPTKNLNLHLDACLNKRQLTEKPVVKRKPLPKLVYNILKDSDLRKKCKELGLNTKGDRRLLVKRHQKYCIIYNSECDLPNPRSKFEILRQVEREEALEKKGSTSNGPNILLKFDKNADSKVIEEKQREYIQANKSSFQQLISQAKNPPKPTSHSTDDDDSIDTSSQEEQAINVDTPDSSQQPAETENCQNFENNEIMSTPPTAIKRKIDPEVQSFSASKKLKSDFSLIESSFINNDISSQKTPIEEPSRRTEIRKNSDSSTRVNSTSKGTPSIQESLAKALSVEKTIPKQECPVCNTKVVERYLNIHLDKCLRDNEPDPSPVLKKKQSTKRPTNAKAQKGKGKPKFASVFTTSEEDTETDEDDFSLPPSPPPRRAGAKGGKRKACQAVLDIDSDSEGSVNLLGNEMDDIDDEQEEISIDDNDDNNNDDEELTISSQNSSHIVMEPSLTDLLSMGLGSKATDSDQNESREYNNVMKEKSDDNLDDPDNHELDKTVREEDEIIPSSNGLDQYTDYFSQASYIDDDSDDMFEDRDDKDETINQHIDNLTDKYFQDTPVKDNPVAGTSKQNVKTTNQTTIKRQPYSKASKTKLELFQTASELMEKHSKENLRKSTSTDEDVEDKVNKNGATRVSARLTRARGKRSNKK